MTRCQKEKKVFVGDDFFEKQNGGGGFVLSWNCFMGCPCVPQCLLAFAYQGKDIMLV
jgi:hypothetical protein